MLEPTDEYEKAAEYLQRFQLRELIEDWTLRVSRERPEDPFDYLVSSAIAQRDSGGGVVTCPNNWCQMSMPAAQFETHFASCINRDFWERCARCNERVEASKLAQHKLNCRVLQCRYCGETILPRMQNLCPVALRYESERDRKTAEYHRHAMLERGGGAAQGLAAPPPAVWLGGMPRSNSPNHLAGSGSSTTGRTPIVFVKEDHRCERSSSAAAHHTTKSGSTPRGADIQEPDRTTLSSIGSSAAPSPILCGETGGVKLAPEDPLQELPPPPPGRTPSFPMTGGVSSARSRSVSGGAPAAASVGPSSSSSSMVSILVGSTSTNPQHRGSSAAAFALDERERSGGGTRSGMPAGRPSVTDNVGPSDASLNTGIKASTVSSNMSSGLSKGSFSDAAFGGRHNSGPALDHRKLYQFQQLQRIEKEREKGRNLQQGSEPALTEPATTPPSGDEHEAVKRHAGPADAATGITAANGPITTLVESQASSTSSPKRKREAPNSMLKTSSSAKSSFKKRSSEGSSSNSSGHHSGRGNRPTALRRTSSLKDGAPEPSISPCVPKKLASGAKGKWAAPAADRESADPALEEIRRKLKNLDTKLEGSIKNIQRRFRQYNTMFRYREYMFERVWAIIDTSRENFSATRNAGSNQLLRELNLELSRNRMEDFGASMVNAIDVGTIPSQKDVDLGTDTESVLPPGSPSLSSTPTPSLPVYGRIRVLQEPNMNGAYMEQEDLDTLVRWCSARKPLRRRLVRDIAQTATRIMRERRKIVERITIPPGGDCFIVGDLHGQMKDLLHILHLMGYPSHRRIVLFNGDYVDRGAYGCECIILILALLCTFPDHVYINRGNHEDYRTNTEHGFVTELLSKYGSYAGEIHQYFVDAYTYMSILTIVDQRVAVLHGGVPRYRCQVEAIAKLPYMADVPVVQQVTEEDKLLVDILWNDPVEKYRSRQLGLRNQGDGWRKSKRGCGAEYLRNITEQFLKDNNLSLVIRSHDMTRAGFEEQHKGLSITIFSASDYCGVASNRGAIAVLTRGSKRPVYHTWFIRESAMWKSDEGGTANVQRDGADLVVPEEEDVLEFYGDEFLDAFYSELDLNRSPSFSTLSQSDTKHAIEPYPSGGDGGDAGGQESPLRLRSLEIATTTSGLGNSLHHSPLSRRSRYPRELGTVGASGVPECVGMALDSVETNTIHSDCDSAGRLKRSAMLSDRASVLLQQRTIQDLREMIYLNRYTLLATFNQVDELRAGVVYKAEWCNVMRDVLGMDLPWNYLAQFVTPKLMVDGIASVRYVVFLQHFDAAFGQDFRQPWQIATLKHIFSNCDLPEDIITAFTETENQDNFLNPHRSSSEDLNRDTNSGALQLQGRGRSSSLRNTNSSNSSRTGKQESTATSNANESHSQSIASPGGMGMSRSSGFKGLSQCNSAHNRSANRLPPSSSATSFRTTAEQDNWQNRFVDFRFFAAKIRQVSAAASTLEDSEIYSLFRFFDLEQYGHVYLGTLCEMVEVIVSHHNTSDREEDVLQGDDLASFDNIILGHPSSIWSHLNLGPLSGGGGAGAGNNTGSPSSMTPSVPQGPGPSGIMVVEPPLSSSEKVQPSPSLPNATSVGDHSGNAVLGHEVEMASVNSNSTSHPPGLKRFNSNLNSLSIGNTGVSSSHKLLTPALQTMPRRFLTTKPSRERFGDTSASNSFATSHPEPLVSIPPIYAVAPSTPPSAGEKLSSDFPSTPNVSTPQPQLPSVPKMSHLTPTYPTTGTDRGGAGAQGNGKTHNVVDLFMECLSSPEDSCSGSSTSGSPKKGQRERSWIYHFLIKLQEQLLGNGNTPSHLSTIFRTLNQGKDGKLTLEEFSVLLRLANLSVDHPISDAEAEVLFGCVRDRATVYLNEARAERLHGKTNAEQLKRWAKMDNARVADEKRLGHSYILRAEFVLMFMVITVRPRAVDSVSSQADFNEDMGWRATLSATGALDPSVLTVGVKHSDLTLGEMADTYGRHATLLDALNALNRQENSSRPTIVNMDPFPVMTAQPSMPNLMSPSLRTPVATVPLGTRLQSSRGVFASGRFRAAPQHLRSEELAEFPPSVATMTVMSNGFSQPNAVSSSAETGSFFNATVQVLQPSRRGSYALNQPMESLVTVPTPGSSSSVGPPCMIRVQEGHNSPASQAAGLLAVSRSCSFFPTGAFEAGQLSNSMHLVQTPTKNRLITPSLHSSSARALIKKRSKRSIDLRQITAGHLLPGANTSPKEKHRLAGSEFAGHSFHGRASASSSFLRRSLEDPSDMMAGTDRGSSQRGLRSIEIPPPPPSMSTSVSSQQRSTLSPPELDSATAVSVGRDSPTVPCAGGRRATPLQVSGEATEPQTSMEDVVRLGTLEENELSSPPLPECSSLLLSGKLAAAMGTTDPQAHFTERRLRLVNSNTASGSHRSFSPPNSNYSSIRMPLESTFGPTMERSSTPNMAEIPGAQFVSSPSFLLYGNEVGLQSIASNTSHCRSPPHEGASRMAVPPPPNRSKAAHFVSGMKTMPSPPQRYSPPISSASTCLGTPPTQSPTSPNSPIPLNFGNPSAETPVTGGEMSGALPSTVQENTGGAHPLPLYTRKQTTARISSPTDPQASAQQRQPFYPCCGAPRTDSQCATSNRNSQSDISTTATDTEDFSLGSKTPTIEFGWLTGSAALSGSPSAVAGSHRLEPSPVIGAPPLENATTSDVSLRRTTGGGGSAGHPSVALQHVDTSPRVVEETSAREQCSERSEGRHTTTSEGSRPHHEAARSPNFHHRMPPNPSPPPQQQPSGHPSNPGHADSTVPELHSGRCDAATHHSEILSGNLPAGPLVLTATGEYSSEPTYPSSSAASQARRASSPHSARVTGGGPLAEDCSPRCPHEHWAELDFVGRWNSAGSAGSITFHSPSSTTGQCCGTDSSITAGSVNHSYHTHAPAGAPAPVYLQLPHMPHPEMEGSLIDSTVTHHQHRPSGFEESEGVTRAVMSNSPRARHDSNVDFIEAALMQGSADTLSPTQFYGWSSSTGVREPLMAQQSSYGTIQTDGSSVSVGGLLPINSAATVAGFNSTAMMSVGSRSRAMTPTRPTSLLGTMRRVSSPKIWLSSTSPAAGVPNANNKNHPPPPPPPLPRPPPPSGTPQQGGAVQEVAPRSSEVVGPSNDTRRKGTAGYVLKSGTNAGCLGSPSGGRHLAGTVYHPTASNVIQNHHTIFSTVGAGGYLSSLAGGVAGGNGSRVGGGTSYTLPRRPCDRAPVVTNTNTFVSLRTATGGEGTSASSREPHGNSNASSAGPEGGGRSEACCRRTASSSPAPGSENPRVSPPPHGKLNAACSPDSSPGSTTTRAPHSVLGGGTESPTRLHHANSPLRMRNSQQLQCAVSEPVSRTSTQDHHSDGANGVEEPEGEPPQPQSPVAPSVVLDSNPTAAQSKGSEALLKQQRMVQSVFARRRTTCGAPLYSPRPQNLVMASVPSNERLGNSSKTK